MVAVRANPRGYRLYVLGRRCHHGPMAVGLAIGALAARQRALAALLLGWALTDWRDFPFRDCDNH